MSTEAELRVGLARLVGARVTDVGRTVTMIEVGFALGEVETRLHAQCPFRFIGGDNVVIGSEDLAYPAARADEAAYAERRTMYDRKARWLTARLAAGEYRVESAELGRAGAVTLVVTGSAVLEVFPACSGPVEQWRLFERGSDVHHVFPDSADH
ncbi:hypothetical protein AB0878_32365 [Amycolatopsis sp. NPDC047767]|uniref:hypothetical protein n=1 Tax=Amycolatopsis sp. NPDC047767 TaxID=3156765 RepID=UPI0034554CB9